MRRSDVAVFLGWPVLGAAELWFAGQGFTTHGVDQVAVEVLGLCVLGACQARFASEGWARSPLWCGAVAMAWTAMNLGPAGLTGLVYWLGVVVLTWAVVIRLERARRWGLWAGVVASLLGAVGARGQILMRASGGAADGRQNSVARSPVDQLKAELSGAGYATASGPYGDGAPIVLLTVDTLRWDAAIGMESFQRIADAGLRWERAMSTSSWTVPSVASMLTGQLPVDHGAGVSSDGSFQGMSPEGPTLAAALSEHGYVTSGVVTNAWLTSALGYRRGFEVYQHADERFHHRLVLSGFPNGPKGHEAEAVVDRAIDWLDGAPARGWFLWVHLIDPHLPFLHATGRMEAGLSDERLRAGMRLTPEVMDKVRAAYQAEVDYADKHLMRLLDVLEAKGVLREGAVLMTSDHGEEFWEHGATGHGHQHHTEVVDVAMALSAPGVAPAVRTDLASLMDVATTLGAIAGVSVGDGHDLREPVPVDRVAVAQGNAYFRQQRSARGTETRAIVATEGDGPLSCYDIVADPAEQDAVACSPDAPVVHAARDARPPESTGGGTVLPREALEALGYVVDDED